MRTLLVVAALLAPAAAIAGQAEADAYSAQHNAWIAERVAATKKAAAERVAAVNSRKALCDKVGVPSVGLNSTGVLKSCWGKPVRVNTTETATSRTEQWVYASGYVYFTDGIVTAIQTSR